MQRVKITKQGDPNEGRTGLAELTSDGVTVFFDGVAVFFEGDPKFIMYYLNEIKTVGNVTVYEATRLAFNQQRDIFSVLDLVRSVRRITGREYLMDGTILRRLRELREDGRVKYSIFDYTTAKYKKG